MTTTLSSDAGQPSDRDHTGLFRFLKSVLRDPSIPDATKVRTVIHGTGLVCAVVATQPLPFADLFVLTPIQVAMVHALSQIRGAPIGKHGAGEIVASVAGVMGLGVMAQQLVLGLYKTVVPFLGGLTTVPLVYGATIGIGYAALAVIDARSKDQTVSEAELRRIASEAKSAAKREARPKGATAVLDEWRVLREKAAAFSEYEEACRRAQDELHASDAEIHRLKAELLVAGQDLDVVLSENYAKDEELGQLRGAIEELRHRRERESAGLQSVLADRFRSCHPMVQVGRDVIRAMAEIPYEDLHALERQIALLVHEPKQASVRCRIHGTQCDEIGFGADGRAYVLRRDGKLVLARVGTKATQKADIEWLRSRS